MCVRSSGASQCPQCVLFPKDAIFFFIGKTTLLISPTSNSVHPLGASVTGV